MEYLLNATQMRRCDEYTIRQRGIPSRTLMENAARGVLAALRDNGFDLSGVLVVCGTGNNGGDGCALARMLRTRNISVTLCPVGSAEGMTEETKYQYEQALACGVPVTRAPDVSLYPTVVDALFGIGLSRDIEGEAADLIGRINRSGARVIAVDIPSGVDADSGKIMGTAIRAEVTVAFAYKKLGHVLFDGTECCGKTVVHDIGVTAEALRDAPPPAYTYGKDDLRRLPARRARSHKGDYGTVLVIAGSRNMSGAAYLAAKAAYRTGAGLVKICTDECNRTILQTLLPEAVLCTYSPDAVDPRQIGGEFRRATAVVIGPGLGVSGAGERILAAAAEDCAVPLVLDADALNLLAKDPSFLRRLQCRAVLTPHPGEMARLTEMSISEILEDPITAAKNFAARHRVICVLKDARTVVSDGAEVYLNTSGCHAMAKAGSGDVLAGIIAGLCAGGLDPFEAAKLGVYLHGLAGEQAARESGGFGVLAGEIADSLCRVFPR